MLKRLSRTLATIAALSALVMVSQAGAANKLVVNGADGTTPVFTVSDTGLISGSNYYFDAANKKFGFGTTNPKTSLHLVEPSAPFDRGLTIAQYGDSIAAAVINIKKAYGTESAPVIPDKSGVNVAAFHAQVYDGNTTIANANGYSANASFILFTEPATAYSVGNVPTGIRFETGVSQTARLERLRLASDGRLRISNQPSAPANNATCTTGDLILDATNGFLYLCTGTNSWKRTSFTSY